MFGMPQLTLSRFDYLNVIYFVNVRTVKIALWPVGAKPFLEKMDHFPRHNFYSNIVPNTNVSV